MCNSVSKKIIICRLISFNIIFTRESFPFLPFFAIDKEIKKVYNILHGENLAREFPYGAAMVSTGVLKYDKRSAQDNRVKMSKLK